MLPQTKVTKIQKTIEKAENEQLPLVFDALGDRSRFRIFTLLASHKDVCVTDIANILGISVPAASQQLKILEISGLVKRRRAGQTICYDVKEENPIVKPILKLLT